MLNFVRKAFRGGLEVILWINLIIWAIGGGIIANMTYSTSRYGSSGIHPFLGVIIGIIFGIILNIIGGGFIATILNIDTNLEKLLNGNSSSDSNNEQNKQTELKKEKEIKIINNTDNTGKPKLVVERGDNVIYAAVPFEIYIDKRKIFSIENASNITENLDIGSHSIYAALDYNTQSEIINFNTDNTEIKFKLSVLGVGKIKLEKIV
jgi:hypothetical protein